MATATLPPILFAKFNGKELEIQPDCLASIQRVLVNQDRDYVSIVTAIDRQDNPTNSRLSTEAILNFFGPSSDDTIIKPPALEGVITSPNLQGVFLLPHYAYSTAYLQNAQGLYYPVKVTIFGLYVNAVSVPPKFYTIFSRFCYQISSNVIYYDSAVKELPRSHTSEEPNEEAPMVEKIVSVVKIRNANPTNPSMEEENASNELLPMPSMDKTLRVVEIPIDSDNFKISSAHGPESKKAYEIAENHPGAVAIITKILNERSKEFLSIVATTTVSWDNLVGKILSILKDCNAAIYLYHPYRASEARTNLAFQTEIGRAMIGNSRKFKPLLVSPVTGRVNPEEFKKVETSSEFFELYAVKGSPWYEYEAKTELKLQRIEGEFIASWKKRDYSNFIEQIPEYTICDLSDFWYSKEDNTSHSLTGTLRYRTIWRYLEHEGAVRSAIATLQNFEKTIVESFSNHLKNPSDFTLPAKPEKLTDVQEAFGESETLQNFVEQAMAEYYSLLFQIYYEQEKKVQERASSSSLSFQEIEQVRKDAADAFREHVQLLDLI